MVVLATKALAVLLIAPITVNILLYEIIISQQPGIDILLVLLNAWVINSNKIKYYRMVSPTNNLKGI